MFGPGRHFPPAELREWERGERLDPEYQLSAKPPSPAQPSPASLPAPAQKSRSAFLQREEEEKEEEERAGRRGKGWGEGIPEVPLGLGLARSATQGFYLGSSYWDVQAWVRRSPKRSSVKFQ